MVEKEIEGKLCLEFFYLYQLKIVTVSVKSISPNLTSGVYACDMLQLESFLDCLFPGDYGMKSPNPANEYQLKKYEDPPFSNAETGCPYAWAQQLAGLHFLPCDCENYDVRLPANISSSFMERTIEALCSRIVSRIHLYNQLLSLELLTTNLVTELAIMFPVKVISQLMYWKRVKFEEVLNHPTSTEMLKLGVISDDAVVFKCSIGRELAQMSALILVFPDYPTKPPVFLLGLVSKKSRTAASSDAVKQLEEEVNLHCVKMVPQECRHNVLMCQVHHLMVCLDVFLKTEASVFHKEIVVTKSFRGRNHSRPYKYISTEGIFTQR